MFIRILCQAFLSDYEVAILTNMLQGEAGRNPVDVENAAKFDPHRKSQGVKPFSLGQHECFGKNIALTFVTGLVKLVADLKKLRPAPGQMGTVKTIRVGSEKAYLNDSWSYLAFDASSKSQSKIIIIAMLVVLTVSLAWKVHFDGHGKGTFEGDRQPTKPLEMQQYYYMLQKRKDAQN
jgi:linoleate 10R-lipoxygenase